MSIAVLLITIHSLLTLKQCLTAPTHPFNWGGL